MNTEVKKYEVVAANSISQLGRFLDLGEIIEMEERLAHTEFAGRLKEVGVEKPTERWEESAAAQSAFEREMGQKTLRNHEKVQLLEHREIQLRKQHVQVVEELKQARSAAEEDQKKATARLAPKAAASQPKVPVAKPAPEVEQKGS